MAKLQAKFSKLIEAVTENEKEVHSHLNEVALAQNQSGVLMMTLLQMLIEKDFLTKEEVETRFEENKKLVLDEDGGCVKALSSLLGASSEGGEKDVNGGD